MSDFEVLANSIEETHRELQSKAFSAVNRALVVRNWLIGLRIVEFEMKGSEKAEYGEKLIIKLAKRLKGLKGVDKRSLFRFKNFYLAYKKLTPSILGSGLVESKYLKVGTASPLSETTSGMPAQKLFERLSYSHYEILSEIEEGVKRSFYEMECIKGVWSVRELKRQVGSLYFERSSLSQKPEKLSQKTQAGIRPEKPGDIIKNVYAFDFLNIRHKDAVEESDLESALLDSLQSLILELGNGFCFEARQKRILIGDTYFFIDLAFYHRVLKCHVLIELKIGAFEHSDIGQLNTYLNYYKQEVVEKDDNPPIGLLLVAEQNHALVKYATAGMDENLFVQQYLLKLPDTETLQKYIEREIDKLK